MDNINSKTVILNLDEIDKFDINKKGKFLFLIGSNFDYDYFTNLMKIIKNFNYIIFFNQEIMLIMKIFDFKNKVFTHNYINNVFDINDQKVIKVNSWGITYTGDLNQDSKYNYHIPNNKNELSSLILNKKFIFPLYPMKEIKEFWYSYDNKIAWNTPFAKSDEELNNLTQQLLNYINPQISLLLQEKNIPNWAINYSDTAQKTEIKINQNEKKINDLIKENEELKNTKSNLIRKNNFLWTDGETLENSIKNIITTSFPAWNNLDKEDNEDLLFEYNKKIYVFEIKGTVKFINEGYLTQLIKYIATIEEKYPESEYTIYPVLFINSQKNIEPKEREFQFQPEIKKRLTKYNISVITSTRLYNLLQEKNYAQLLIKDIETSDIHNEKINNIHTNHLNTSENIIEKSKQN